MAHRDVIVIGASAGGLDALLQIVRRLPATLDAALFVVIHTSAGSPGLLPSILSRVSQIPVTFAADGERIARPHVYVAPPDHHLLLERGGVIRLSRGPRENGFRPAIDPLFRTAAEACAARVIGIVLSGGQNDGTIGLATIKKHAGFAIVQQPDEAFAPDMPRSAMRHVAIDRVGTAAEIGDGLAGIVGERMKKPHPRASRPSRRRPRPPDSAEVGTNALDAETSTVPGRPTPFICPECGGPLWERRDSKLLTFACHVGHRFTGETLVQEQGGAVEQALWTALRVLQEGAALRKRMGEDARAHHLYEIAKDYDAQGQIFEDRAAAVRRVLVTEADTEGRREPARKIARRARRARTR